MISYDFESLSVYLAYLEEWVTRTWPFVQKVTRWISKQQWHVHERRDREHGWKTKPRSVYPRWQALPQQICMCYSHGAYVWQSVEGALHNAGNRVLAEVPVKMKFGKYSPLNDTVLWTAVKVSTHRIIRFVKPVNILLWTSLSLFSDRSLRNDASLLGETYKVGELLEAGGTKKKRWRHVIRNGETRMSGSE